MYGGCLDRVFGYAEQSEAEQEFRREQDRLGIIPGLEEESEHDVQLQEIEVEIPPMSVAIRRMYW